MSSITSDQEFLNAKANLSEPHFDEEATVLSARPVVPLEEVRSFNTGTGWKRIWVLGLGLAGALLVGVFATAIYYSQSNGDDSSVFEGFEVTAGAEGISDEAANSFSGPASPQPIIENVKPASIAQPAAAKGPADKVTVKTEKRPRLVAVIRERKSNNHVEEEQDRRAARRQARRERRRGERERRDAKSSDELLRIRDIFEGSPRP
ncbi:MAG TPA: hypothetical protein VNO50_17795 [Pyrinomonadaceae bacterium]|nr:hypothetical protein [Pyrinomonadaceae bacterium]